MTTLSRGACTEDLGTIGPAHAIAERNLLEVIQARLKGMAQSGELAKLQEGYQHQVIADIEQPRPIPGIRPTETARTFYLDPTFVLDRPVVDEMGNVLFPAGTRVNPFDYDRLNQRLLFFDAQDEKQVAYALRFLAESSEPAKPILTGGEPLKLMRAWKRAVYFDQGGALSRRLHITQSPAVVSQEGKRLRIDEIRL